MASQNDQSPLMNPRQSARGLAHSTTLSHSSGCPAFRQVMECASPLALSSIQFAAHMPLRPQF
jgi:hypothetical protein